MTIEDDDARTKREEADAENRHRQELLDQRERNEEAVRSRAGQLRREREARERADAERRAREENK